MNSRMMTRVLQGAILLFVVALLLSEFLLYAPPGRPHVEVSVHWERTANGTLHATVSSHSTFSGDFSSVALERNGSTRSDVVYFYFDPSFPISYSDIPDWFGLSQHLVAVAEARGLPLDLRVVDTAQLEQVLRDPATESSTVLFASGVLPAPLFSASVDRVDPWIRGGGLVVWVGDLIGVYSGLPGQGLSCGSNDTLGVAGTARFLNVSWLYNNASSCSQHLVLPQTELFLNSTAVGSALGVDYPYGLPGDAFVVSKVELGGGFALGGVVRNTTNVAYVPHGAGGILDFSGPATDPIRLSYSIDDLLQSGILSPGSEVRSSHSFAMTGGTSSGSEFWWPPGTPTALRTPCVFTVQTDYLAPYASESCAPSGL